MKKLRWVIGLGILGSAAGGAWYYFKPAPPPPFETLTVKRSDLQIAVTATGGVQAKNRLEIKPPVAGRIEEILVREGEQVKKGTILAWMSSTERVALVDTASARGPKERKRWEKMYRPTPILAPLTGALILRKVEPGQTVIASDIVLVMSDRLMVRAEVDETDIGRIKVGQDAKVTLDAYPKDSIQGKVHHIAFDAKVTNNVTTYSVDILTDTVPDFMRSGMSANVTFEIEHKENVLTIPSEAIQTRKGESFVLIPGSEKPYPGREVAVKTGMTDGKRIEVTEGLEEGSQILLIKSTPSLSRANRSSNPFMPMGGGGRGSGGGGGGRRPF